MEKLQSLQLARAIAVLSVVIYHILLLSNEYAGGLFYDPAIDVFESGVDIFFVISGVVMVVATASHIDIRSAGKRFIIHRVSRIYPPYLVLTLLVTVFWLVHPNLVNQKQGGVDLLASYTLLPSNKLPLVPVAWTLSYEMMFYIVFFFLIVTRQLSARSVTVWGCLVVVGYFMIKSDFPAIGSITAPYGPFLLSPFVVEFVAGCILGFGLFRKPFIDGKSAILASTTIFISEAYVFHQLSAPDDIEVGLRVLLFAPPAFLLIYGLWTLERAQSLSWAPNSLLWCGKISYSIYLVHILLIHAAYRFAWPYMQLPGTNLLFIVGLFSFCIAASAVFHKFVEVNTTVIVRNILTAMIGSDNRIAVNSAPKGG